MGAGTSALQISMVYTHVVIIIVLYSTYPDTDRHTNSHTERGYSASLDRGV